MRTSAEMFALFELMASADERIRAMTLEGSRVNPCITADPWQDYDITYLVTDVESFRQSDDWLAAFGEIVFMQMPEAMELFLPDFPSGWFSYLMLFSDGVRIDLTLVPVADVKEYFSQDPLIQVLLDKDGICPEKTNPSDACFWVQQPKAAYVRDCANEFFFICTCVAKGLLRNELLFANWHFEQILRKELHRMLGYLAGVRNGFPLNTGKRDKWLPQFLSEEECEKLFATYQLVHADAVWNSLYVAMQLFEDAMREVCDSLAYDTPVDVEHVRRYIDTLKQLK